MNPYYLLQRLLASGWGNYYDDHYTLEQVTVNYKSVAKQYKSEQFRIVKVDNGVQTEVKFNG
jgi:hypothetical protein